MENLETISLILCFIPTILYILVIYKQYKCIEDKTLRLIVLSTRAAACLPAYAFCIYISFMEPYFYVLMEGPITFIEGYSFYCFFTLIVVNCGGPEATVKAMEQTNEPLACTKLLCKSCKVCPNTKRDFYRNSNRYLFHFCWTRTIITVVGALFYYSKSKIGYLAYVACACLSAAILLYAPFYLFNLYDNIYRSCTNIYGVGKVVLMKVSVSLITYLGIMEIFLVKFDGGYRLYGDQRNEGASVATHRAVCLLLLALLSMLAVLSYPAFSKRMTAPALLFQPPPPQQLCPDLCSSRTRPSSAHQSEGRGGSKEEASLSLSLCGFLLELASLLDIVNTMELQDDNPLALDHPLAAAALQADALEKGLGVGAGAEGGGSISKSFGRVWEDCWTLPGEGVDGDGDGDPERESSFSERRMIEMMRLGSRSGSHGDSSNATHTATAHTYTSNATSLSSASSSSLTPAHIHGHSRSHSGDDQDQQVHPHPHTHHHHHQQQQQRKGQGQGDAGPVRGHVYVGAGEGREEEDSSPNRSVDISFGSIYPQADILSPGIPALVVAAGRSTAMLR